MPQSTQFQTLVVNNLSATILQGESESSVINTSGTTMNGIITPSNFTGTDITFKGSLDGITYYPINDLGTGLTLAGKLVAGEASVTTPTDFAMWNHIKIVADMQDEDVELQILARVI